MSPIHGTYDTGRHASPSIPPPIPTSFKGVGKFWVAIYAVSAVLAGILVWLSYQ
jgi:hypothetical protein